MGTQKRYSEPLKYEVGKDITGEQYTEALEKIAIWFEQTRPDEQEPLAAARRAFQECLDGVTKEGKPWFSAALSTLTARVKVKCRFDLDTMLPLYNASDERRKRKQRQKELDRKKREAERIDPFIPETLRKEQEALVTDKRRKPKYGDDANLLLSSEELRKWRGYKEAYLRAFPVELGSIAAQAELDTLCDLHILNERHRLKLLHGEPVHPKDRESVVTQLDKLKNSLGIHPNQLSKRVKDKADTTIGAAVARLEAMGDWRDLRARFFAEEMILSYQRYMELKADGSGYQLDKVGLFGETKCATCSCAKCGQRNFVGLKIEDVEAWLVKQGWLTPVDSVPEYERPVLDDEADEDEQQADAAEDSAQ